MSKPLPRRGPVTRLLPPLRRMRGRTLVVALAIYSAVLYLAADAYYEYVASRAAVLPRHEQHAVKKSRAAPVAIPTEHLEDNANSPRGGSLSRGARHDGKDRLSFPPPRPCETIENSARRHHVIAMTKHAWSGYVKHAAGHDELKPVTGGYSDKWGRSLVTPIDALGTLLLMDLRDEFDQAAELALYHSRMDSPVSLSVFEMIIRHVGSFVSVYGLTEDPRFLTKAIAFADRLLPAFEMEEESNDGEVNAHAVDDRGGVAALPGGWRRKPPTPPPARLPNHQAAAMHRPWRLAGHLVAMSDGHIGKPWSQGTNLLAELGSNQLEFRYLSLVSGNAAYGEAASDFIRLLISHRRKGWPSNVDLYDRGGVEMPHRGLWPSIFRPLTETWSGAATVNSMSDSAYEYLLKQWLLFSRVPLAPASATTTPTRNELDGGEKAAERLDAHLLEMYEDAVEGMLWHGIKYAPHTHWAFVGHVGWGFEPTQDHLGCFFAGTLALGVMSGAHDPAGVFDRVAPRNRTWTADDVARVAIDLASGCFYLYVDSPSGIAPEIATFYSDSDDEEESGDPMTTPYSDHPVFAPGDLEEEPDYDALRAAAHLATSSGTAEKRTLPSKPYLVQDPKYILRPELLESLFYLYRMTGDETFRDWGWHIVTHIDKHCRTPMGFSALHNVTEVPPRQSDDMESFFFAETLKYAFLLFSSPDVVPLDAFVFNTEGHPFAIPDLAAKRDRATA